MRPNNKIAPIRSCSGQWRVSGLLAILIAPVLYPCVARAQAPAVPPVYQDLYSSLNTYLTNFNATLPPGSGFPVLFAGNLKNADGNAGPQLVNPGSMPGILLQLQELKAIGVQAVMVQVGFPILYEPFLTSQGQSYDQFVSFYQQVAASIRAAGLKLIIENDTLLTNDVQAGWDVAPFYATLDWTQYQQARAQTALTVAQTMQPDYLVVLEEPTTEADNSGQTNANTPGGSASLLSEILTSVQQSGVPGMLVGAGTGTAQANALSFIQQYVTLPVDFIDMHIYPINYAYLPMALQIASTAAAAGKPVGMTECWLWKVRDDELGVLTNDEVRARDPFSFWEPLDAYFLQTMQNLAASTNMLFIDPFGSEYLAAYLTYDDSTDGLTPTEILDQESAQAAQNMQAAMYSPTAMSYYASLVTPPDQTPPSTPGGVTGQSYNPNAASLNWNASTDNVGVAGYYVLRNGATVATTANQYFQDSGLTESTTYSYSIEAFDLAGNISVPSAPINVTTRDVTPPTPPANLTASAPSSQRVTLNWSPSTDNLGVQDYIVFWGISPGALSQAGRTPNSITSYTSYPLTAGTTYYYGVEAVDTSGNISAMSTIVAVTTPMPPSAPAGFSATPISAATINMTWTAAGSGGLPVQGYHVLRGSSASSLATIATVSQTTYVDRSLTPATTYYYAIQAVDTGGDTSPLSTIVQATTIQLPTPPTNIVATAYSAGRIGLTWSAASGGLPIQNYRVWRGSTPNDLTQVAIVLQTSYTDYTAIAATTYYYALVAADSGGDVSPMSAAVEVTTPGLPLPPAGLVALPLSGTKISLTWLPSLSGGPPIQDYRVFRGNTAGNLSQIGTVSQTTYRDTTVTPGSTYYYAVEAMDADGDLSPISSAVQAITPHLPSPPTGLAASPVSTSKIGLTWVAPAGSGLPIQNYRVFKGTTSANLVQVAVVLRTSYTDSSDSPATTYYYAVEAADTGGDVSGLSSTVPGTTMPLPSAPSNLTATAPSRVQVNLTWTEVRTGMAISSFTIYRGSSPTDLTQLRVVAGTASSFTDYPVSAGTTYYYAVRATDTGGNLSPLSQTVEVTTPN